jgi:hypothetical protein
MTVEIVVPTTVTVTGFVVADGVKPPVEAVVAAATPDTEPVISAPELVPDRGEVTAEGDVGENAPWLQAATTKAVTSEQKLATMRGDKVISAPWE